MQRNAAPGNGQDPRKKCAREAKDLYKPTPQIDGWSMSHVHACVPPKPTPASPAAGNGEAEGLPRPDARRQVHAVVAALHLAGYAAAKQKVSKCNQHEGEGSCGSRRSFLIGGHGFRMKAFPRRSFIDASRIPTAE